MSYKEVIVVEKFYFFTICFFIVIVIIMITVILKMNKKIITIKKNNKDAMARLNNDHRYEIDKMINLHTISLNQKVAEMNSSFEKLKKEIAAQHSAQLSMIRQECSQQIRQMQEYIETRKDILFKMSDKELLVNVMLALEGYSKRFERLEHDLSYNQITDKIEKMSSDVVKAVDSYEESLNSHIEDIHKAVSSKVDDLNIINQINDIKTNTSAIENTVESLKNIIIEDSNELNSISSIVEDIQSDVGDIASNLSYYSRFDDLDSKIETISSEVSSVHSDVDDIKTSVSDKYSYDSLASSIDSISSDVSSIRSDIDSIMSVASDAKDAAESARDAIESHY